MKIIILGAGQVGGTLAENLVRENNDVTLIDLNQARLNELQQRLDIRTIHGHASHPDVLIAAGIDSADMLIAVTSSDETNMIGCQIAYTLFQTPMKIARVRAAAYVNYSEIFDPKAVPVDVCISPEQLVTDTIYRLIKFPGALQVLEFAEGLVQLAAVRLQPDSPMCDKAIHNLQAAAPELKMQVVAIFRRQQSIAITDSTILAVGDEVFFIASPNHVRKILNAFSTIDNHYKHIMIAGGGHIGYRLAQALENDYNVKIVDHNADRAEYLAEELHLTTVLQGDASDIELIINENIDHFDVFCAVTNDDEANIMSCLQAKRLGVRQVIALINRTTYVDLVEGSMIDIAISPQQATIGSILTHLRRGDMVRVHSLRRGAAEAIEVVAHGDEKTSQVVGRMVNEIKVPPSTMIGAIIRGDQVLISKPDLIIQSEDHIVLFVLNKKSIKDVERLFQVKVGYFG